MKLIPLKNIKDVDEFWRGTRFRIYNVGYFKNKRADFFEYMLAQIPGDHNHMLLTNVRGYKAGAALGLIKISKKSKKVVVNGKAIKYFFGLEDTFLIKVE